MNKPQNIFHAYLALYCGVAVILFLRLPSAFTHPNFFAEDGMIFFKQQYELGFRHALFTHYGGYLNFVPRIVAGAASFIPLLWQPLAYSVASLGIAALALTFFFLPWFRPVIASDSLRALIVLIFTLMPNQDSLMKLAYANWYMALILVLTTLMSLPANRWFLLLVFAVVSLSAWTTPVGIACLPLIIRQSVIATKRSERIWWALLSLQIIGYFLTTEKELGTIHQLTHDPAGISSLVKAVSYKVFCFFFLGDQFCNPRFLGSWFKEAVIATVAIGACAVAMLKTRKPVLLSLAYLIIATSSLFVLRPTGWRLFLDLNDLCWSGNGRYFLCSTLLLCVFWGVAYENLIHGWVVRNAARQNLCVMALLAWLSVHGLGFRQWEWYPPVSWAATCQNITLAKNQVSTTHAKQIVPIRTSVMSMDFDLAITP